jgi:hypothetical protein
MKAKPGWLRQFCTKVQPLGFEFDGYNGTGHPVFRNAAGETCTTSLTPSDWRGELNAIAAMERMSGRKLRRDNAARYHHLRVAKTDMRKSQGEQKASGLVDGLLAEAAELRNQWDELISGEDRTAALKARKVLSAYEVLRVELDALHRIIPPINGDK